MRFIISLLKVIRVLLYTAVFSAIAFVFLSVIIPENVSKAIEIFKCLFNI